MSCYDALAPWYDSLTGDVPYGPIADFYESVFQDDGGEFRLLLDLCCGTGSMTWELAGRGYEMIAADRSEEMLMVDDLSTGLEMARAAGIDFAAACWAYDVPEIRAYMHAHAERCFDTPAELERFLFE